MWYNLTIPLHTPAPPTLHPTPFAYIPNNDLSNYISKNKTKKKSQ